jgi:ABC-2 type transport system permease protein
VSPFLRALSAELTKTRHSRVPWGIAIGFSLAPVVGGLFMIILKDPDAARSLGLLGTKAQLTAGTADWPTFLNLIGQAVAVGGAILFAFLTGWVFGREFTDRTIRGLLANPTPRRAIVTAKFIAVTVWGFAVSIWVVALGLLIGVVVGLPGWSADQAVATIGGIVLAAVLTIGLQTTTAFFAGAGRGYLAPLGWAIVTIIAAQILTVLGWGAWFPWSVPALLAGAGGAAVEPVTAGGVVLALIVVVVGGVVTIGWWERADQTT